MASFPDLRPDHGSAPAERWAARSFRRLAFLLARSPAVFSAIAFPADSELATLHGAKAAVRMPAFLTHVREPAPGNRKLAGATA